MSKNIVNLITQLTLEEKASLCSGIDDWHTTKVDRLNIPQIMVADGPHGLRKQDTVDTTNVNRSVVAVCFPAACATSCTFNSDLLEKMGRALGEECQAEKVSILLGPGVNIKRSPLCGRNFEYFSEDPYITSVLSGSLIKGIQSQGVGACIKHYAGYNQETRRLTIDDIVDERALREIYLAAFEGAIKDSKPWSIMCSYNMINGKHSAQNHWLLTEVLRDEWGFDGLVISDWGAVVDRPVDLIAGLDLQMPGPCNYDDGKIVKAVKNGICDEKILDTAVSRILGKVYYALENQHEATFDREKHHEISKEVCEETVVLMKNENNILPLKKESKIAFIGEYAEKPRIQGGGSSHINVSKLPNALETARKLIGSNISYAKGFSSEEDIVDEKLFAEALKVAKEAEVVVIFAGLPESFETEGIDRTHINMPECQNKLIIEVAKVNPNVVVCLHNGCVVLMPWLEHVKGFLELYLGGQAIGEVIIDVLFGKVNPSGHIAETFIKRIEDNPTYIDWPGHGDKAIYMESIFVGYRYYDAKNIEVVYPFGHGLSYTTFEYSNLQTSKSDFKDNEEITVSVDIKNTGKVEGKAVAQLYIHDCTDAIIRPQKELKGFGKVSLQPGEKKTVTIKLNKRSFAWYNPEIHDWYCETGNYDILIGQSSRDIVLSKTVHIQSTSNIIKLVTINTTYTDMLNNPITAPLIVEMLNSYPSVKEIMEANTAEHEFFRICVRGAPLRCLQLFFPFDGDYIEKLIEKANKIVTAAKH